VTGHHGLKGGTFAEKSLRHLLYISEYAVRAESISESSGLLQSVDPRVKAVGVLGLIVVVAASHRLEAIAALFAIAVVLALFSRIPIQRLALWVWTPALIFTGAIALPAVFLTPGLTVATFGGLDITRQGLRAAAFLLSRAETVATMTALLVLTTPWPRVLRALRALRVPVVAVVILGMTYRYIFVMLHTALEMLESRKSRTVGVLPLLEGYGQAGAFAGVLLSKSVRLSEEVHLAMQSRGFRGEVHLLDDLESKASDWFWLAGFAALSAVALWWQLR